MMGYGVWSAGSETFEFLRTVCNPGLSEMLPEHTKSNLSKRSDVLFHADRVHRSSLVRRWDEPIVALVQGQSLFFCLLPEIPQHTATLQLS